MNTQEVIENEKFSIAGFKKRPIVLAKGKNAVVYDSDGMEYIDCISGIGVANIGHCNSNVTKAISKQLNDLMICPPMFHNEPRARLLQKLSEITGLGRGFLCNSGTEAVEAAIKFARISTHKTDIISCVNGFHGRTLGSLSATWKKNYREPFEPLVPGFSFVPFNNIKKLETAISSKTAAIILEIIQGEGGLNIIDKKYLEFVRKLCDDNKIMLIIDEVQTGFGRTGKMFAHQHFNIKPDILTLAKSMAGGLPMGAVICNDKVQVPEKVHANTFGGYPVVCAASLATIKVIENENLCKKAADLGKYFMDKLKQIESSKIREVRGLGLMVGVELKEKPAHYVKTLMENGILCMTSGLTVLRFLPPLTITKKELDIVIEKIKDILL